MNASIPFSCWFPSVKNLPVLNSESKTESGKYERDCTSWVRLCTNNKGFL